MSLCGDDIVRHPLHASVTLAPWGQALPKNRVAMITGFEITNKIKVHFLSEWEYYKTFQNQSYPVH